jgi:hypothetical protein
MPRSLRLRELSRRRRQDRSRRSRAQNGGGSLAGKDSRLEPGPQRDCYERNIATFNLMIQLEGERSPQFSQDLLEAP